VRIYDGVGHSYMNDYGAGPIVSAIMRATPLHAAYDEPAAEDSWRRMFEFFARHL
jgi:carboxymethylenebutenolidase